MSLPTEISQAENDLAAKIAGMAGMEKPAEETTSTEDAAAAAESEAGAQAADETKTEEKPAEGRSDKLQKILEKYGGDADKAAEAIFESWNTGARLSKEVEKLKKELEAKAEKADEAKPVFNEELQGISQEYQQVEAELAVNNNRQSELIGELAKVEKAIAKLEGKAEVAEFADKAEIKAEIRELKQSKNELTQEYRAIDNRNRAIGKEKNQLVKEYRRVESDLRAARAQERQTVLENAEFNRNFRESFDGAVMKAASELGVPASSQEYLLEVMRAKGTAFLMEDENGPGFQSLNELEQFVKQGVKKYADDRGYKAKAAFKETSQGKLSVAKPQGGEKGMALPKLPAGMEEPKGKWTAEYAKKRAEMLLP